MPDLNHSIDLHNRVMHTWWKKPEYIEARKAFVARHQVCIRCGRPCTTPGHSHEDYRDYQTYLNAVITDKCDPLCSRCNNMERSNRRPCPVCVAQYTKDPTVHIHYITPDQWVCRFCDPQFNQEKAIRKKELLARAKKELGRTVYNRVHGMVKIPVNGRWVKVQR
jgi:hypothetical protein